jgi:hypothetical protein
MLAPAVAFSNFILAVHFLGVVIGFGVVFAYPVLYAVAARNNPSVTPWLLHTRKLVGRYVVNPGLLVVLLAGIYLASDEHRWSSFFVGWGVAAVVAIGARVRRGGRGAHRRGCRRPAHQCHVERRVRGGGPAAVPRGGAAAGDRRGDRVHHGHARRRLRPADRPSPCHRRSPASASAAGTPART